MITTIIFCLLAAVVAAGSGYALSFRFNRSNYAATDTSGDFGAPRGGFILTFAGLLIGVMFVSLASHLHGISADAVGPAFIVATITGAIAGFVGMTRGQKARAKGKKK